MNDRFTERIAEAYSLHSQGYASILEPILTPMADEIISLGGLKGGERVLDLATGTGLIARTAAHSIGTVIGVDISPGILKSAQSLSGGKIPLTVGDAHKLPFGNQRFHLVTCGLSLSHFPDVPTALGEVLRVLLPKGRFITSAWGSGGVNPSKEAAVEVRRRFLEDRELTYGGEFNEDLWADPELGCETLRSSGFADVRVTTLPLPGEYRNPGDAIEAALAWPLTRYRIAKLDPTNQKRLIEDTIAAIHEIDDLRWQTEIHYYQAVRPEDSRESS
jgi:SAM-dependent methyltransferase